MPKPPPRSGAITRILCGGQLERGGEPLLDEVDDLRAVPGGERSVAPVPLRHHAARLDRHAHVALDVEASRARRRRPRRRRARSRRMRVGEGDGRRCSRTRRGPAARRAPAAATMSTTGGSGSQSTSMQLGGVLGAGAALGHHHGDDLADVAGAVAGRARTGAPAACRISTRAASPGGTAPKSGQGLHPAREVGRR